MNDNLAGMWLSSFGISLRDYFAAKFLEGYVSAGDSGYPSQEAKARTVKLAYQYADAMLAEREKKS